MDKHSRTIERVRAGKNSNCQSCGMVIMTTDEYYRESVGAVKPSLSFRYFSYCIICGFKRSKSPARGQ